MSLYRKIINKLLKLLFPKAEINSPRTPHEETIRPPIPILPHLPYKRPSRKTKPSQPPLTKKQKLESSETSEKSTQTPTLITTKSIRKPIIPQYDLPSFKTRYSLLKLLPSDPESVKFSKLYEKYFPSQCFKTLQKLPSSAPPHSIFPTPTPTTTFVDRDLDGQLSHGFSESVSNLSDTYITPDESPIISAAPAPSISSFSLESPLIHNSAPAGIEGWGLRSNNFDTYSPQFPQYEENDKQESYIKPVILFPVPEEREEQSGNDMDILISREASTTYENLISYPMNTEEMQGSDQKNEELTDNTTISSRQSLMQPFSMNSNVQATSSCNDNPFLNINTAQVARPAYVFGSGKPLESTSVMSTGNPFLPG